MFEVTGKGALVTGKGADVMGNAADVTANGAVVTGNDVAYTAGSVSRLRSPYEGIASTRPWAWLMSGIMGCIELTSPAEARCVAASDRRSKLHAGAGLGAMRESGGNVDTTVDMERSPANCGWVGDCWTPSISESPWLLVGLAWMVAADDFLRVLGMTLSFVPSLRCTSFSWRTSRSLISMLASTVGSCGGPVALNDDKSERRSYGARDGWAAGRIYGRYGSAKLLG